MDITFLVEERNTGSINFGTAVGGGTGVSGFLGYDQPNLFGQAKAGHLRWDFGRYINSFTLSFTDPALFQSRVSGTLSFFNSRDRFFQFATGRRQRQGFSTRFGFPVPWSRGSQVLVGYSLSRTEYKLFQDVDDNSLFGLPPGTQSTFTVGITRTNLDHPLFPTVGSRQSWTSEFNGGILGGDGDFTRHMAEGSWYVPAWQVGGGAGGGRPIRTTLGLHFTSGAVFGDVTQFPFDRFWMGGVQFGENLRGYDETSITPLGYYPERSRDIADIDRLGNAFMAMTAEFAIRVNDNLSISTFLRRGEYLDRSSEYRPDKPVPRCRSRHTVRDAVRPHRAGLCLWIRQSQAGVATPLQDGSRLLIEVGVSRDFSADLDRNVEKQMRVTKLFIPILLVLALGSPAGAQTLVKIGYIDSKAILDQDPAAQSAQQQFESEMTTYRAEVQSMGEELTSLIQATTISRPSCPMRRRPIGRRRSV